MRNNPMVPINIYLPESLLGELKALSAKTGAAYSELIRRAIRQYLKQNGAKP